MTRNQTERPSWPRLRATAACLENSWPRSSRFSKLANTQTRNGTSLRTSTVVKATPQGSWLVIQGGGTCHPVTKRARIRAIKPAGMIRKAKPMPKAKCGTARNLPADVARLPRAEPTITRDNNRARRVDAMPVMRVSVKPPANWGWASMAFNAKTSVSPGRINNRLKISGNRKRATIGKIAAPCWRNERALALAIFGKPRFFDQSHP